MTIANRTLLALVCTVSSAAVVFAYEVIRASRFGFSHAVTKFDAFPVIVLLSLVGWVASLPLALGITEARGKSGWAILGIGTLIGPALVLAWALSSGRSLAWRADASTFLWGTVVAFLTSLQYVLVLRRVDK